MGPVRVVLGKELSEIFGNRSLLASLCALPLVMVAVALSILSTYTRTDIDVVLLTVARYYVPDAPAEQVRRIVLEVMVRNSIGMFLIMPVFLPVLIASHALAAEKERRTLEPLLAAPVTAAELVLGKTLAAVLPALGITVLAFAFFAAGADVIAWPIVGGLLLPDASFLFAVLVLAPLLSFLGTTISVLISARVGDSRLAQTLSGLVVMPFAALVVLQVVGLLQLGPKVYGALAMGAFVADWLMLKLAVRFFDRERLLTRWS